MSNGVGARDIEAIEASEIHQIVTSQVISNVANAVKELVENAMDAKSTRIEVKLTKYGCEAIEVIDNGLGVSAANLPGVARRHHTSKVRLARATPPRSPIPRIMPL